MTVASPMQTDRRTRNQAIAAAAVCLTLGIAGGWLIRGFQVPAPTASIPAAVSSPTPAAPSPAGDPGRLKAMADANAAPLLAQLNSTPESAGLLTSIGNLYYDAQQYQLAIGYYERALKSKPSDAAVRTDMATAYWYLGNADTAIAEFNKALAYQPDSPNTLFNLGLVKWQGKSDAAGAIADWKKLLATDPNYAGRDKVAQMIAEAEKQAPATAKAN